MRCNNGRNSCTINTFDRSHPVDLHAYSPASMHLIEHFSIHSFKENSCYEIFFSNNNNNNNNGISEGNSERSKWRRFNFFRWNVLWFTALLNLIKINRKMYINWKFCFLCHSKCILFIWRKSEKSLQDTIQSFHNWCNAFFVFADCFSFMSLGFVCANSDMFRRIDHQSTERRR